MSKCPMLLVCVAALTVACSAPTYRSGRTVLQSDPAGLATGAQEAVDEAADDGWSWSVVPYLWAADLDGQLDVKGREVDIDVPFSDTLDNMDAGGQLMVQASRDLWTAVVDATYLNLSVDGEIEPGAVFPGADIELKETLWIAHAGAFRRLGADSNTEVGVGVRYLGLDTEVRISGQPNAETRSSHYNGIVMARHTWTLAESLGFMLYGDVGTGDTDLTWSTVARFNWLLGPGALTFGYRLIDFRESGKHDLDLTFSGLLLGYAIPL